MTWSSKNREKYRGKQQPLGYCGSGDDRRWGRGRANSGASLTSQFAAPLPGFTDLYTFQNRIHFKIPGLISCRRVSYKRVDIVQVRKVFNCLNTQNGKCRKRSPQQSPKREAPPPSPSVSSQEITALKKWGPQPNHLIHLQELRELIQSSQNWIRRLRLFITRERELNEKSVYHILTSCGPTLPS